MVLTKVTNSMIAGAPANAIDIGAIGNGTADNRLAFFNLNSSQEYIYVPSGVYRIASNLTLTKVIRFAPGAILRPDSGVTITLTGEIDAGSWRIFDISAGGTIAGTVPNQFVRPEWWGAAPNIPSNQAPMIQAAITFAESNNRTVYIRNGLWRCDQTLFMRQPASIVGDPGIAAQSVDNSMSTLDFSNAPANQSGLVIGRVTDFPLDGITLRDIAIYRNTIVAAGSGCIGLTFDSVMQAECVNVQCWNWDRGFAIQGSVAFGSAQCKFDSCRSQYAATYHWDIWSAFDCLFDRCSAGGGPALYGFYVYNNGTAVVPNALHWTNCILVSPTTLNGIRILAGFWHSIEDCVFEELIEAGILISITATDLSLTSVIVSDCWFNACGDGFASIGAAGNFRIRDNRIEASNAASQYGIVIDSSIVGSVERDIVIDGNMIKHAGSNTVGILINHVRGAVIENNRIICSGAAAANAGIGLGTDTTQIIVSGNRSQTTFASTDGISNNGSGNAVSGNTKWQ